MLCVFENYCMKCICVSHDLFALQELTTRCNQIQFILHIIQKFGQMY